MKKEAFLQTTFSRNILCFLFLEALLVPSPLKASTPLVASKNPIEEEIIPGLTFQVDAFAYHQKTKNILKALKNVPSTPTFPEDLTSLTYGNTTIIGCEQWAGISREEDLEDLDFFSTYDVLDCCVLYATSGIKKRFFHASRRTLKKKIRKFFKELSPKKTKVHLITGYLSENTEKCLNILMDQGFELSSASYSPVFGIVEDSVDSWFPNITFIFPQRPQVPFPNVIKPQSIAVELQSGDVFINAPPPISSLRSLI
jgi:hypothetical protein